MKVLIFHVKGVCIGIFYSKYLSIPLRKIFIGLAKQVIERLASQGHQLWCNHSYQGWIQGRGPGGLVPPKIEHLNFWWQPSFYPIFYFNFVIAYLYFLIFLFWISFFNYNWKMAILIVYLSLICIYSIMLIFSHLSLITILNKI